MKKLVLVMFVAIILLTSVFAPLYVYAADVQLTVYIPNGTSLTTERVLYNAIAAAGGSCYIEERHSGIDSVEAIVGRNNAIAAGVSSYTQIPASSGLARVNIPVGKVEYAAYMRKEDKRDLGSWAGIDGLTVGVPAKSSFIMSHFERYTPLPDMRSGFDNLASGKIDVYVDAVYDDAVPQIPEGLVLAGIVDATDTYCWYNMAQPGIAAILIKGLEALETSGVYGRITSRKSVEADNSKVIFQLSSYSTEMIWESQAEETLRETLAAYDEPVSLYIHNMNFRQTNFREAQYQTATSFVRSTFMSEYPDVIIAMDNDALAYLQANYTRLFNGVPVVFCGINSYNQSLITSFAPHATGISEYIDPTQTVEFALRSNPNITRIHTIFDETSSASPVKASLLDAIKLKYGDRMEITSSGNQTFAEVVREVQGFDKNTMVLIGTYFSDKNGRFMPESEVAQKLCAAVDVPVYSLMSGYLGYGVVGGRVAYSRAFIEEAVHMAMRVLGGEPASQIPIVGEWESENRFNTFIVDKHAADRFGIAENLYKENAIVLNEDRDIFEEYPVQSTAVVALIFIILLTSVLCILLMRSRRMREIAQIHAEKEKEHNRMKSDFLARMSHEIRTPLNAIIGMDELILLDRVSPKIHQNAAAILHSGRTLLAIINDLLDFSKIEAGKMELVNTDYDAGALLYDVLSMTRIRVSDKPVEVKMEIAEDFPASLYGDETRVRQILLNFLTNAAKYTSVGRITLKADFVFETEEKTQGTAIFTVSDTGMGIKEDDRGVLFDAFAQVDAQTNRKVEGTGLGLAITKTLAEMMDGSIEVQSEYGKGSVFTACLRQQVHAYTPLQDAKEAFTKSMQHSEIVDEVSFVAPDAKILAVDDLEINLMVITGLLGPYEAQTDMAGSGVEAIEMLQKNDYDLVFMDHMMPGMDGVETTRRIREMEQETQRRIPIIALTANTIAGMKEMFFENGFDDFISKPVEIDELDKILCAWVPKEKQHAFEKGE